MQLMSQAEREAARDRIMGEFGFTASGDAPGGRPGLASSRPQLAIEVDIAEIQSRYGMADVWARPGLSMQVRSAITLAILTALRESTDLETHVNNALHLGLAPEEIHEIMLHAGVYGGLAAWNQAANVARKVFVERGVLPAE